jgi:hypothetical protein
MDKASPAQDITEAEISMVHVTDSTDTFHTRQLLHARMDVQVARVYLEEVQTSYNLAHSQWTEDKAIQAACLDVVQTLRASRRADEGDRSAAIQDLELASAEVVLSGDLIHQHNASLVRAQQQLENYMQRYRNCKQGKAWVSQGSCHDAWLLQGNLPTDPTHKEFKARLVKRALTPPVQPGPTKHSRVTPEDAQTLAALAGEAKAEGGIGSGATVRSMTAAIVPDLDTAKRQKTSPDVDAAGPAAPVGVAGTAKSKPQAAPEGVAKAKPSTMMPSRSSEQRLSRRTW